MAKRKQKTPEELQQEFLKRALIDLERNLQWIPEPTYIFKVGDRVTIGNLNEVFVEEVLYDGKIYKVDYEKCDENYGNPIITPHCKNYWSWVDVRPYRSASELKALPHFSVEDPRCFRLNYSQRMLEGLFLMAYRDGINMNPEYQRNLVWTPEDKIDLLHSIFNNVDIGKFVVIKNSYEEGVECGFFYEILDGKQRLQALLDFYENRFPYNGKYFNDLSFLDQYKIRNCGISYAEVSGLNRSERIELFLKVNTTGKVVDKKHLEKIRGLLK